MSVPVARAHAPFLAGSLRVQRRSEAGRCVLCGYITITRAVWRARVVWVVAGGGVAAAGRRCSRVCVHRYRRFTPRRTAFCVSHLVSRVMYVMVALVALQEPPNVASLGAEQPISDPHGALCHGVPPPCARTHASSTGQARHSSQPASWSHTCAPGRCHCTTAWLTASPGPVYVRDTLRRAGRAQP